MSVQEIQTEIDKTEYWDVNILDFQIAFFGDEAFLYVYNDETSCWKIHFSSCYEIRYRTDADKRKISLVKSMKKSQLGYYGYDIKVTSSNIADFYKITIDLSIMNIEVICKNVKVGIVKTNSINFFWMNN